MNPVEAIRRLPRAAYAAAAVALALVLLANAIIARPVENLLRDSSFSQTRSGRLFRPSAQAEEVLRQKFGNIF